MRRLKHFIETANDRKIKLLTTNQKILRQNLGAEDTEEA